MRGYRTLKCRFLVAAVSNGCSPQRDAHYLDMTIDSTLDSSLLSREHVVVRLSDPSGGTLSLFQMTIAETERLIAFLDAGLLEHRRRLDAMAAAHDTGETRITMLNPFTE